MQHFDHERAQCISLMHNAQTPQQNSEFHSIQSTHIRSMQINCRTLLLILSANTLKRASSRSFTSTQRKATRTAFVNNPKRTSFSSNTTTWTSTRNKSIHTSSSLKMVTMDSPSAQRNKDPIYSVLENDVLPLLTLTSSSGSADDNSSPLNVPLPLAVLEIAAGCGVHTTHFVSKLAEKENLNVQWIPTDPDPPSLESLKERVRDIVNIHEPMSLSLGKDGILEDDTRESFSDSDNLMDLMICINMIHISPWTATLGLFQLSNKLLRSGGVLFTYGPYKQNGTAAESNLNFDRSLKSRNPDWGVRDFEQVVKVAEESGFSLKRTIEMPANNLSLIFVKN